MAWDVRGSKSYYYRSLRIGGKVHRIYYGTREAAEQAAAQHKKEQEARKAQRRAWLKEKEEWIYCRKMI